MRRLRYFSYGNNIKCSSLPKQLCSGASTSKLISSFEKEKRSIEGEGNSDEKTTVFQLR